MIKQDFNIQETEIFILGNSVDIETCSSYLRKKNFTNITTVNFEEESISPKQANEILGEDDRVILVLFFLENVGEVKFLQEISSRDNCGIYPVVSANDTEIMLIILQKTNLKDIGQKPLDMDILFVKIEKILISLHMHKRIIDSNRRNRDFFLKILKVMAQLLEKRDEYTEHHSENVAMIACKIARKYDFSKHRISRLEMAGLLHDFGKIGVKDNILNKAGSLTDAEYDIIKKHPSIAQVILEPVKDLSDIIPWIKYHHEKWDGSGYPEGLRGEDIPLEARILAVADAYDTMHAKRTYHDPFDDEYILNELINNKGSQFDPEVVDVFLAILEEEELDLIA